MARTPRHAIRGTNFDRRDYFRGTLGHSRETGLASVHVSSVYHSIADAMYKFNVCAPVVRDSQTLGVVAVSVTTDATMGIANLHDESRKAVLLAPWDRNRYEWEPDAGPMTDYLLLLHPGYRKRGEEAVGIDPSKLPQIGARRCGEELEPAFSTINSGRIPDYSDPFSDRDPAFGGRWLAGFAPVGNTGFFVIIQQRDE